MPTYEYECDACDHKFEVFHAMSAEPIKKCPRCGKNKVRRLIGCGAGIIFKGSGFYCTDYRSDSYRNSAKGDKSPSSSAAKGDGSSSSSPAKSDSSSASSTSSSSSTRGTASSSTDSGTKASSSNGGGNGRASKGKGAGES